MNKPGLGQIAVAAEQASVRKPTSADSMVNEIRAIAERIENLSSRIAGALQRLGTPQPPTSSCKGPAEMPSGFLGAFNEQGNRARAALNDAENYLTELEQHF